MTTETPIDVLIWPVRWDELGLPRQDAPLLEEWHWWLSDFQVQARAWHKRLSDNGQLFVLVDCWMLHHVRFELETIFGPASVLNELIWVSNAGSALPDRWDQQHQCLLWIAKSPKTVRFRFDQMERIPYMAPGLVSKEKRARGKTPTDVWWHSRIPQGDTPDHTPPPAFWQRLLRVHATDQATVLALGDCQAPIQAVLDSGTLNV